MPEGPTIVILCEECAKFRGKLVRRTEGNTRIIDPHRMLGKKALAFRSWGKHFLVQFSGFTLKVHFMLFGRYRMDRLVATTPNARVANPRHREHPPPHASP